MSATTVLLDFGTDQSYRGATISNPDTNGNSWNGIRPGLFFTDLVDQGGVATTIDFGFDGSGGTILTDSFNGPAGATSNPPTSGEIAAVDIDISALGDFGIDEAAFDFVVADGGRFQVQGLDPTMTYNFTFFASRKFDSGDVSEYSVFDDAAYSNLLGSTDLTIRDSASPWLHNRDTLATLNGLSPSSGGILYVEFSGNNGAGVLNAMSITAIPEPASATLLKACCLVGLLTRRR